MVPNWLGNICRYVVGLVVAWSWLCRFCFGDFVSQLLAWVGSMNALHKTAILMVKAYVETYEGKIQKKKINYENYPQTTHGIIGLILFATLAFNIALWPHYGWNSPILLGLCFFGVILQFLLIVPTYVQNIVGIALFTFFMQEYSSGVSVIYY